MQLMVLINSFHSICQFKFLLFHFLAIHLPCGAVTCKECILVNQELFCHSCHETHIYTDSQISQMKKDKLCLGIIDTARESMLEEISKRSQNLNGKTVVFFLQVKNFITKTF